MEATTCRPAFSLLRAHLSPWNPHFMAYKERLSSMTRLTTH